ncbi:hypothetical protein LTS18_012696 [Coniosporium uncinatum]|uniref:Uncharacterized protein n=1 Tax=Coniosporium uncinatum TaxID=93489 RepID=A0ACC3DJ78_9PEZI|nr:hypothetical protein LTS18_012696 [Coniosporium uncinatum]
MSAPKKQRTTPTYELLYHPGIPGRGEYIRLALEAAGVPYKDPANEGNKDVVYSTCSLENLYDGDGNPPPFAPPALRVPSAGKDGKTLVIYQTPNILMYLGGEIGMAGEDEEVDRWFVNELALTALDASNEAHDTHHPVAAGQYYEGRRRPLPFSHMVNPRLRDWGL